MNSRERFLTTINKGIPDKPPLICTFTPQAEKKMSEALGVEYKVVEPGVAEISYKIRYIKARNFPFSPIYHPASEFLLVL